MPRVTAVRRLPFRRSGIGMIIQSPEHANVFQHCEQQPERERDDQEFADERADFG